MIAIMCFHLAPTQSPIVWLASIHRTRFGRHLQRVILWANIAARLRTWICICRWSCGETKLRSVFPSMLCDFFFFFSGANSYKGTEYTDFSMGTGCRADGRTLKDFQPTIFFQVASPIISYNLTAMNFNRLKDSYHRTSGICVVRETSWANGASRDLSRCPVLGKRWFWLWNCFIQCRSRSACFVEEQATVWLIRLLNNEQWKNPDLKASRAPGDRPASWAQSKSAAARLTCRCLS